MRQKYVALFIAPIPQRKTRERETNDMGLLALFALLGLLILFLLVSFSVWLFRAGSSSRSGRRPRSGRRSVTQQLHDVIFKLNDE